MKKLTSLIIMLVYVICTVCMGWLLGLWQLRILTDKYTKIFYVAVGLLDSFIFAFITYIVSKITRAKIKLFDIFGIVSKQTIISLVRNIIVLVYFRVVTLVDIGPPWLEISVLIAFVFYFVCVVVNIYIFSTKINEYTKGKAYKKVIIIVVTYAVYLILFYFMMKFILLNDFIGGK